MTNSYFQFSKSGQMMIKDIFSDGVYSLFNKICYFGFKTISIILITRSLGESTGGEFIFLVGFLEILRVVTDFGVDLFVIKKYNETTSKNELLNIVITQKLIFGLLVSSVYMIYCGTQSYDFNVYIPIVIALPVSLLFNLSNSYFQSQNSNKSLTLSICIASLLTFIIFSIQYLSDIKFSSWDYLFVEILFVSLVNLKLFSSIRFRLIYSSFFRVMKSIATLYKHTVTIGLTAIAVIIYSRIDNFYLKIFAPDDLAAYGQIFRMVDPLVMVSSVFSTVAYAKFCRVDLHNKQTLIKIIQFLFCIIFYGVISSAAYFILIKYFGHYLLISNVNNLFLIKVFLIIACIKCVNGGATAIIQSQGYFKIGLYVSYLCILTSLPTMYLLVSKYGVKGAAMTILIVEGLSFTLLISSLLSLCHKKRRTAWI